jgi:pimeloyl-ACP methyl ester carboxylesterase
MQAMIRAAVPTKNGSIDWKTAEDWQARYRMMNVPSLILWGSRDTALPEALGYRMQAQIPNSRLRIIDPAKHSLMIEQPQACIDLIGAFIRGEMEPTPISTCRVQPLERPSASVPVR